MTQPGQALLSLPETLGPAAALVLALPRADEPLPDATPARPRSCAEGLHARPLLLSLALHAAGLGLLWVLAGPSHAPPAPARVATLALAQDETVEPEIVPLDEDLDLLDDLPPPPDLHAVPESPPPPDALDALPEPEPDDAEHELVPLAPVEVSLATARLRLPARPVAEAPAPPPPPAPRPRVEPPPPAPPRRARPPRAPAAPLRILHAPDPRRFYPARAAAERAGGLVRVELTIDAAGLVVDAVVVGSSGRADLDAAALALARAYRFSPGDGVRRARLPVTFAPPG